MGRRTLNPIALGSSLLAVALGAISQMQAQSKTPYPRPGKKILFIDSADIIAVEAEGHYVLLQHKSSGDLLRESISTMAEKLSLFGLSGSIHRLW
jgi:DNA-binding LytR/AlgR family response regulator